MGRRRIPWQLLDHLRDHHGIAGHDMPGQVHIAGIGRVGHDVPAIVRGILRRLTHRRVVIAVDPNDLCAQCFDCLRPSGTDAGMHVDPAGSTKHSRAPGNRPSVIAVRRGDHGDCRRLIRMQPLRDPALAQVHPAGIAQLSRQQFQHRIGAAQRLEAAQAEPRPFVLIVNRPDAQLVREAVQEMQGCRRITWPGGNGRLRLRAEIGA